MIAQNRRDMYLFLMIATLASQVGLQGWMTLITNFSVESAGLSAFQVGAVQSIREIPGFLALLVIYVLLVVSEHRAASLALVCLGLGVAVTGLFPSFAGVAATGFLMSVGFHAYETLNQSLTLQYFDLGTAPLVLGRMRSWAAAANIGVGVAIWFFSGRLDYAAMFGIIGAFVTACGLWACTRNPADQTIPPQLKRMVWRRKYWLFYVLTFLSGARRQVFMVFATFLLVKKFGYGVQAMTVLFVINNAVGYVLNPLVGRIINRVGESRLMTVEYLTAALVFLVYAACDSELLVAAVYILDSLAFNFVVTIRTYFQKIADPRDIAPSTAVGFTVNHIAAVFIPVMGGWLWLLDRRIPFYAGAALALVSVVLAQFAKPPREAAPA